YRHSVPVGLKGKMAYLIEYANALFWELFLAIKIYIKKPFHIIHAGNPPDTIFLIALLFRIMGVKFVYDIHDLSPELYLVRFSGKKNRFYKLLVFTEKLSCKLADAIITANRSYSEIVMNRHNKNPKMVFVVRNDPIVNEFFEREEY
ncbi:MAG: glycosyltransferase, partial [Candidatus Aenigmarchaeota archaeon]|nr:glycosyltransferase [Candidatus Aenigmarchaeota archaeon]